MNADQVYEQSIKPLSSREKLSIARRILTEIEAEAPLPESEEAEDLAAGIPDPLFAVRDQAHLEELLLAGLDSPTRPFTDDTTEQIRQEVYRRYAARRKP